MKRRTILIRAAIIDLAILVVAIVIIIGTARMTLAPTTPTISKAKFTADSMAICDILTLYPKPNVWETRLDSMPPGGIRLNVDHSLKPGRTFNDSNYLHINAAESLGIDPINSEMDAWHIKRPIVHVTTCEDNYVDKLTHSHPYLVPEAELLLRDIGRSFRDSLQSRGGGDYRIKVTSILRTHPSIKRLRRRNGNAVGGSAHLYGTTFDISYSNFICDNDSIPRTVDDMKMLLGEILLDLRDQDRCFVKHERKQACFHITTRPIIFTEQ